MKEHSSDLTSNEIKKAVDNIAQIQYLDELFYLTRKSYFPILLF